MSIEAPAKDRLFPLAEHYLSRYQEWREELRHLTGERASNWREYIVPRRYRMGRPTERIALQRYRLSRRIALVEECLALLNAREHEFVRRYYWEKKHLADVAKEMGMHRETASNVRRAVVRTMIAVLEGLDISAAAAVN